MPIITSPLNPNTTGQKVKDLQNELIALGQPLDQAELNQSRFGASTISALRAFRERFNLPSNNSNTVDPPTGQIMRIAASFASEDDVNKVRAVLQDTLKSGPGSPDVAYWLARFAIIVGDYQLADQAAEKFHEYNPIAVDLLPILDLPGKRPRPPEVPYPENFYSYKFPLIDPDKVVKVLGDVDSLTTQQATEKQKNAARFALTAFNNWHNGNQEFQKRHYAVAANYYTACQDAVARYFDTFYDDITLPPVELNRRLILLIARLSVLEDNRRQFWEEFRTRRRMLSLKELAEFDFVSPTAAYNSAADFVRLFMSSESKGFRENSLDAPLVTIAFVLAPLARAEANRLCRQFELAIKDLQWVLDPYFSQHLTAGDIADMGGGLAGVAVVFALPPNTTNTASLGLRRRYRVACEFIELPFAKLLMGETLADKADTEYKARIPADPATFPEAGQFQNLQAAQTYQRIFKLFGDEGEYVTRVQQGRDQLANEIQQRLDENDTNSQNFQILGKDMPIPTINPATDTLPGLDRRAGQYEGLLDYSPPPGQSAMMETNPRVYTVLLNALARLEQIKAGFNYLGYRDDYVPPWRFQFLLERTRYFAEHAKNAQSEYLNFLNNAEHEEFQELSTAQNVVLEKSNIQIETARVEQNQQEVKAAHDSAVLAGLTAQDAQKRLSRYQTFEENMNDLENQAAIGNMMSGFGSFLTGAATGNPVAAVGGILGLVGGMTSQDAQTGMAREQRALEEFNLNLAVGEAQQAAVVARSQLGAARAGLVVAGLQRTAALLRHEFAVQNLNFLRNRALNAEQWYRLANAIRDVSETYLQYAVELAFLAEQAYEFEADKRINVIRFDYDTSELGGFLAADFLLRDLDTLEQDLLVNQRQRQQQTRYIISMAREFPEALQELRDTGITTFSLRLEQFERRFPGLYNLRIGTVDVTPVALMDTTRFSLGLTYLGSSQIRLKAQPDTQANVSSPSPLNINDLPVPAGGWLSELQDLWPVKIRVNGPETGLFSGLSRQDISSIFPFASNSQRNAFEGIGAAATWQVDMSMKENQVVPGTLADLLITLNLSGYYDSELRNAIDQTPHHPGALTQWLSARQSFPDAFYEFNRSGRMEWPVTNQQLTFIDKVGALRNAGLILLSTPKEVQFGRLTCSYQVDFRIAPSGNLEILSEIPQLKFTNPPAGTQNNALTLTAQVSISAGAIVTWDFGDNTGLQSGALLQHTYAKPGQYKVVLRIVRNGRMSEYNASVVVSKQHTILPPLTALPSLSQVTNAATIPPGHSRVVASTILPTGETLSTLWRLGRQPTQIGNELSFDLLPGDYSLSFTAVRTLQARVYCHQRFTPEQVFAVPALRLTTNRVFDQNGILIANPPLNAFSTHLFQTGAISPVDNWTLEFALGDNPYLRSATYTDTERLDLSEVQDIILSLEYDTISRI